MDANRKQEIEDRSRQRALTAQVRVFHDFESENAAEADRRAKSTVEQRMLELAIIRRRLYGELLAKPMERVATWEYTDWHKK